MNSQDYPLAWKARGFMPLNRALGLKKRVLNSHLFQGPDPALLVSRLFVEGRDRSFIAESFRSPGSEGAKFSGKGIFFRKIFPGPSTGIFFLIKFLILPIHHVLAETVPLVSCL